MINNTVSFNTETSTPATLLERKKKRNSSAGLLSMTPSQPVNQMKATPPTPALQPAQGAYQVSQPSSGLINGLSPEQTQQLNAIKQSAANPQPQQSQRGLITPPNFGGLVGQVAQGGRPNYAQRESVGGLMGGDYQQRIQDAIAAQERAVNINQSLNQGVVDQSKNAIPLSFQQGRAGAIQRDYGVQADAATRAAENAAAIAGLTQQGLSSAGGLANTQQGQRLQGLESAAGLAAPQITQYGQTSFNPVTQEFGGGSSGGSGGNGGSLNPLNNIDSLAQQVLAGQISPSQALSMGGNVSNFQGALNQAILAHNPQANLAQLQGQYDARQSNTTVAGTAPTNAYAAAYQQTYPEYLQTQTQLSNVEQLGNMLLTTVSGGQINPFDPRIANETLSYFQNQLSSPDRTRFQETLNNFQSAASQLLSNSSGQIPTEISNSINALGTGSLSLLGLKALVDQAQKNGSIKLNTLGTQLNTAGAGVGAPRVGAATSDYQAYLQAIGQ